MGSACAGKTGNSIRNAIVNSNIDWQKYRCERASCLGALALTDVSYSKLNVTLNVTDWSAWIPVIASISVALNIPENGGNPGAGG